MTSLASASGAPRKLPLWRSVVEAYVLTVQNLGYLARISWAWILLTVPVALVYHSLAFQLGLNRPDATFGWLVDAAASMLLYLPMLASIAVAWHRKLLAGEEWPGWLYLRLDRAVLGYLGLAALVSFLAAAPMFGIAASTSLMGGLAEQEASSQWIIAGVLASFLAIGVGLFVSTKIWLALPARALGRSQFTLGQAWRASDRNFWRLFVGCFLCSMPIWVIAIAAAAFDWLGWMTMHGPLLNAAYTTLFELVTTFLVGMPVVSLLSLAYRRLVLDHTVPHDASA